MSRFLVAHRQLLVLTALLVCACPLLADPPAHKKWKLVFSDEFEGPRLDESKWTRREHGEAFAWNGAKGRLRADHAEVDGKGHFVVRVSRDADGTYNYHHGVDTRGKYEQTYGYFETRVKFSRQPGWWGAVWMYGVEVGPNPFLMGQEIDIFEDFRKPKTKNDFAHNVHLDAQLQRAPEDRKKVGLLEGDSLYRVSRGTSVVVDDWNASHVVGVEWTPLEYVFYCDGRETFRLDYREVPVTNQPMRLLISGCFRDPRRATFQGDYADGAWPDEMVVDYVRAYQEDLAGRRRPEVSLRMAKGVEVVSQDQDVTFEVAAGDDGKVENLLLFANGRIRAEKAGAASATFTLPGKRLFYGRNILIAMARDNDGLIGMSKPLSFMVRGLREGKGQPYQGRAQTIPGRIIPGHYDEGGQRVAYSSHLQDNRYGKPPWNLDCRKGEGIDSPNPKGIGATHRGLWVAYTVQVEKTGDYEVVPFVARPDAMVGRADSEDRIILELDGRGLTEFVFSGKFTTGRQYWGDYKPLPPRTVRLSEGRHVLQVRFEASPFNFGGLELRPAAK